MTEALFLDPEEFWLWFDRRDNSLKLDGKTTTNSDLESNQSYYEINDLQQRPAKKMKREGQYMDMTGADCTRYKMCWGRHRPGKKTKVWEGDGFITLIGNMAHVSNEDGRILEEPVVLDEAELEAIRDFKELLIGKTEIMVDELVKS